MAAPLRIQSVTLPVRDLEAAERLYRWSFRLEPRGTPPEGVVVLGWGGGEDRLWLVDADRRPELADAVALRLPAAPLDPALQWVRERDLRIVGLRVPPADRRAAAELAPAVAVEVADGPADANLSVVTVELPGPLRLDLVVPLPEEIATARGPERLTWRSGDWSGLETPGILGVTWGAPDPGAARAALRGMGASPLAEGDAEAPLRIGDQQLIVEERPAPGVYALALVLSLSRLAEVKRTLEHLNADLRESGTRLLTRDPAGRLVLVHGVRAA